VSPYVFFLGDVFAVFGVNSGLQSMQCLQK